MYMRGRTGTAVCRDWGQNIEIVRCTDWDDHDDILPVKVANGLSRTVASRSGRTIENMTVELSHPDVHDYYRNFCKAIDGEETQLVTHAQMKVVMRVIEAAFESAKDNKIVTL